jgi:hypothetical protein
MVFGCLIRLNDGHYFCAGIGGSNGGMATTNMTKTADYETDIFHKKNVFIYQIFFLFVSMHF